MTYNPQVAIDPDRFTDDGGNNAVGADLLLYRFGIMTCGSRILLKNTASIIPCARTDVLERGRRRAV